MSAPALPVNSKERHIILDALRGIALFGICLANYSEFSLYSFLDKEVTAAMPTAGIDRIVRYAQYIFIDGKFYTLFSILFGIGFSIILSNSRQKGYKGKYIFYRRMIILAFIGLFHLIFIWAGDILILYALMGLLLPFTIKWSDRKLLFWSALLLVFPVLLDACRELYGWDPAAPAIHATQYFHGKYGITETNFPVWLAEKQTYQDILKFNVAGSFIRLQEFIDGNRAFKVLSLFLLGLYIGRNRIYAELDSHKTMLKKVCLYGFVIGFPATLLYAWSAMNGQPFGLTIHSALYTASVLPLSLGYITAICLWYAHHKEQAIFRVMAASGRMALTNYIMQSVMGMIIFYGIGFGLGARVGLVYVEIIAVFVFLFQILYSYLWLGKMQYGPLEWVWRMLTYGKWLTNSTAGITKIKNEIN